MQICLIAAPMFADFSDPQLSLRAKRHFTQLGVLCLAASVAKYGHRPSIVDPDRIAFDLLSSDGKTPEDRFAAYVDAVARIDAPLFGFSSNCSSYPLTIRLAREVKRLHPLAHVILGGPQASAVDVATLEAFPWVDAIVRGEADWTFPLLLDALESTDLATAIERIPGATFRCNGQVVRNANTPLVADLDDLPLPAFELDPMIRERKTVHLEVGRGCPFSCTFCSTSMFFGRKFRLKSTHVVLEQMKELHKKYGVTRFALVHDMFPADRKRVVEFAEAILNSGESYEWTCSARTDRVDEELLALMAKSGCAGIFFGVETGSLRLQRVIDKRLDLQMAWEAIRSATAHGMETAISCITGFPEEEQDDLVDTVQFIVRATQCDHVEPQLTLLAPLAETPIEKQYRGQLTFDHIYSDVSHQGWREDPEDLWLIKENPRVFPNFYGVPTLLPRRYLEEVRTFVEAMTFWLRWLAIALANQSGNLVNVFDEWTRWHDNAVGGKGKASKDRGSWYYYSNTFVDDFLTFATCLIDADVLPNCRGLRNVIEYERALYDLEPALTDGTRAAAIERASVKDLVKRAAHVAVRSFPFDVPGLLASLRRGEELCEDRNQTSRIAFAVYKNRPTEILQLPDRAAELLLLCDGESTIEQVVDKYSSTLTWPENHEARRKVALAGLMSLYNDGLIEVCRAETGVYMTGVPFRSP